ncbi:MAG TPA: hypothetical protein VN964_09040 [Gemmatimonadales bacterium]|nr:hypothetical protein [Gemmatimonadales bacterium]
MRQAFIFFLISVLQGGAINLSDVAGTWKVRSMVGPKDSVVATSVVVATAGRESWIMRLEARPPIPLRIVAVGGDSIVTECGPYPSILRKGLQVTVLRNVSHYKGGTLTGTFEAHYSSGDVFRGKTAGQRMAH